MTPPPLFTWGDVVVMAGPDDVAEPHPVTVRGRRPDDEDASGWTYSVELADGPTVEVPGAQLAEPAERSGEGFHRYVTTVVGQLRERGVELADGLDPAELAAVEQAVGAPLPPELSAFLTVALPVGERWPDWRGDPEGVCSWTRQWVEELFAFDVEHNGYWSPLLGARPAATDDAIEQVRAAVAMWPPLVRVHGHRFMPTAPTGWGNPVLSVFQAVDSIVYGADFAAYLSAELGVPRPWWARVNPRPVPVWSDALEL